MQAEAKGDGEKMASIDPHTQIREGAHTKIRKHMRRYFVTCRVCHKRRRVASRRALYCSDACKQVAYRERAAKRQAEAYAKTRAEFEAKAAEEAKRAATSYRVAGHLLRFYEFWAVYNVGKEPGVNYEAWTRAWQAGAVEAMKRGLIVNDGWQLRLTEAGGEVYRAYRAGDYRKIEPS